MASTKWIDWLIDWLTCVTPERCCVLGHWSGRFGIHWSIQLRLLVHWQRASSTWMHKCIMVKLGGNEKHIKYVKTRKFYEIRGTFAKVRGNKTCPKIGWTVLKQRNRGKFKIFSQWLKRSSEILADENRKICLNEKFSTEPEFFLQNRVIWNRGEMHHCLRGWMPLFIGGIRIQT